MERREFLRLSVGGFVLVAGGALAGCGGSQSGGSHGGSGFSGPFLTRALGPIRSGTGRSSRQATIAEGDFIQASINNSGQVAFSTIAEQPGQSGAVIWQNGTNTEIPALDGKELIVTNLNDAGQVCGFVSDLSPSSLKPAFLYADGQTSSPFTIDGIAFYCDINNPGQMASTSNGPFLFSGGAQTRLPLLPGHYYGYATALNNGGQVTGFSLGAGTQRAVVWEGGTVRALAAVTSGAGNYPLDINDSGQVIGTGQGPGSSYQGFLWQGDQAVLLEGVEVPHAINNSGHIVGAAGDRAVLWKDGKVSDLNAQIDPGAGITLRIGCGINDQGQIIAVGNPTGGGRDTLYLLDPNNKTT